MQGCTIYKVRLLRTKIRPLSMYMELHDVLYYIYVLQGNYASDNILAKFSRGGSTRQQNEFVSRPRLKKLDENFWIRASKQMNIVQRSVKIDGVIDKVTMTKLYQTYFQEHGACYNNNNNKGFRNIIQGFA